MKLTVEQLPESQVLLDIVADEKEVNDAMDRAFRTVSRQIRVPGFRPGKAPRHIIDRIYGPDVYVQEAHRLVVDRLYRDAVKQESIIPVGQPSVEITEIEPLAFKVTVPVFPAIDPGDYESIRIEPRDASVSDEDVEETLDQLRKNKAEWIAVEDADHAPVEGERVKVDLVATENGEPYQDPVSDALYILGETPLFDKLKAVIQNLRLDQSASTTIEFDEDDEEIDERVRGKSLQYEITLKGIEQRQLPELDDEFAQSFDEVESLEALRAEIRRDLHRERTSDLRQEAFAEAVEKLAETGTLELPAAMVDDAIDEDVKAFAQRLAQQGIPFETYLQVTNTSEEAFREERRERVANRLRNSLLLREVAEREGIVIDDDVIDSEIDSMTARQNNPAALRELYSKEGYFRRMLRDSHFDRKLTDRLLEIATEGRGAVTNPFVESDGETDAGDVTPAEAGAAEEAGTTPALGLTAELPAGAIAGTGEIDCVQGYPIKGNASSMIYHVPGSASYERTIPEMCFATEEDATAAGYRPSKSSVKASEDE